MFHQLRNILTGFDSILINGGSENIGGKFYIRKTSALIPLGQATNAPHCPPPNDMIEERYDHAIGISGGNLTVCGGVGLKTCSFYDKARKEWMPITEEMHAVKDWFPWVQLDENRIWMGRK